MKVKTLKRTGWILILCGLVGVGITTAEMMTLRLEGTIEEARGLKRHLAWPMQKARHGLTGFAAVQ